MTRHKFLAAVAVLLVAACDDFEDPVGVPNEAIIHIERTDSASVHADGVSTATFRATIPPSSDVRTIAFKSTLGVFRGGDAASGVTVPIEQDGRATAVLNAGTVPGTATVTASVTKNSIGYTSSTTLTIQPAFPDALVGEISSPVVTRDGKTSSQITVLATRVNGTVSSGVPLTFTAQQRGTDGVMRNVGRFTGLDGSKLTNGKAMITFVADTGDVAEGPVVIRAVSVNDAGAPVTFEVTLQAM